MIGWNFLTASCFVISAENVKMFLFKETKVMQGLKIPKYLFEH